MDTRCLRKIWFSQVMWSPYNRRSYVSCTDVKVWIMIVTIALWAIFSWSLQPTYLNLLEICSSSSLLNGQARQNSTTQHLSVLVSALCNFNEKVGSPHYIHVYFNTRFQHITLLWCNEFHYVWQIVTEVGHRNCAGHQITQKVSFYIMFL